MIIGAHSVIYTRDAEADRAFLRDVLGLPHVDAGGGWLIFGLPPSEVGVHPSEKNDAHELYLLCDDVGAFIEQMEGRGVACGETQALPWGLLTYVELPGGGRLGIYEPRHARPRAARSKSAIRKRAARKTTRKTTRKKTRAATRPRTSVTKRAKGRRKAR